MRLELRLSVKRDEEIQYAAGGHPLDGPPVVAPPPGRIAVSGWECVCHDDRGYTWGRRVEESADARQHREASERRRVEMEHEAAMVRETARAKAVSAERLVVLREWFPGVGPRTQMHEWRGPQRVTLAMMRETLANLGQRKPSDWKDGWRQLWGLAGNKALQRVKLREATDATD